MDGHYSDEFSDNEEIPEIDLTVRIQPYMYEPTRNVEHSESSSSDESEENESEIEETENEQDRLATTYWCTCSNCSLMPSVLESKCCQEINIIDAKIEEAGIDCITQHEGFEPNCLNIHVIEVSYYEFIQDNGPLEEHQQPHEVYRHIAYRRFSRFIWKILGKRNRRVLPSCVVTKIRERFPSQNYCGFRYPL